MNQERLRRDTLRRVGASTARIEALRDTLTPGRMAWTPPAGGWSIGMVLEHVCLANTEYLERMGGLVESGRAAAPAAGAGHWRASLMGWLLVKSLEAKSNMPAPTLWLPGEPRANVIDALLGQQRRQSELLEAAAGLVWRRLHTTSPVSSLVRLNLGDCFVILAVHTERHLRQIDRIAAHASYPALT